MPTADWSIEATVGHLESRIDRLDITPRTPASPDGASHATEIGYVFANLGNPANAPTEAETTLSGLMSNYWVNFAKNADPNGPGLPPWPAFSDGTPQVMHFDDSSGAHVGVPNLPQLKALDDYFAWQRERAGKAATH